MSNNFVDYDYDLYGYTDYRGGYNDSYYDDYFRSYDGEQFFDYTANSGTGPQNTNQRNNRNISVGEHNNTHNNNNNYYHKKMIRNLKIHTQWDTYRTKFSNQKKDI